MREVLKRYRAIIREVMGKKLERERERAMMGENKTENKKGKKTGDVKKGG